VLSLKEDKLSTQVVQLEVKRSFDSNKYVKPKQSANALFNLMDELKYLKLILYSIGEEWHWIDFICNYFERVNLFLKLYLRIFLNFHFGVFCHFYYG
jgi:hypothetical protein